MPQNNSYTGYLKTFFFVLIGGLVFIAIFSIAIDPYWIYGTPQIKYFNKNKPEFGAKPLIGKSAVLQRMKPDAVILGSSRPEIGLNPSHPGWRDLNSYNLASPASSIYQSFLYFHQAQAIRPLKLALLSIEFTSFYVPDTLPPDYSESYIAILPNGSVNPSYFKNYFKNIISKESLKASWKTLEHNISTLNETDYSLKGQRLWREANKNKILKKRGGYRHVFIREVQRMFGPHREENSQTAKKIRRPQDSIKYKKIVDPYFKRPIKYYRAILKRAYRDGVDVRMIISPSHAWFWEAIWTRGKWPLLENWKRAMVLVNEEEARLANSKPFSIWDFSGYNSITTETVPPINDTSTAMQWYWEASHYTQAVGDLILNQVLNYKADTSAPQQKFGVLISSDNIEQHLAAVRKAQIRYRTSHQQDIALIRALGKESGF